MEGEETFSRKVATVSDPNPQLGQEVSWVEVYTVWKLKLMPIDPPLNTSRRYTYFLLQQRKQTHTKMVPLIINEPIRITPTFPGAVYISNWLWGSF